MLVILALIHYKESLYNSYIIVLDLKQNSIKR